MDASLVAPQLVPVSPCSWSLKTTRAWCSLRIMGCLIFTLCSEGAVASSRIVPGSNGSSAIRICGGYSFSSSLRSLSSDVASQFWGVRPDSWCCRCWYIGCCRRSCVQSIHFEHLCAVISVPRCISGGTSFGFRWSRGAGSVVETSFRVGVGLHHPSHLADSVFFFFFGHAVMESVWEVRFDEVDLRFVVCRGKC
jgi:hypothetical protein